MWHATLTAAAAGRKDPSRAVVVDAPKDAPHGIVGMPNATPVQVLIATVP